MKTFKPTCLTFNFFSLQQSMNLIELILLLSLTVSLLSTYIHQLISKQAPRLTSADVHLTKVSDLIMCIQNNTIGFNINTSIPIVEVPAKLESLVSFDVQELNVAKKFGRWIDHRIMAVFFVECVTWDSSTTSGKERPIHIMFEANEGLYLYLIYVVVVKWGKGGGGEEY